MLLCLLREFFFLLGMHADTIGAIVKLTVPFFLAVSGLRLLAQGIVAGRIFIADLTSPEGPPPWSG